MTVEPDKRAVAGTGSVSVLCGAWQLILQMQRLATSVELTQRPASQHTAQVVIRKRQMLTINPPERDFFAPSCD